MEKRKQSAMRTSALDLLLRCISASSIACWARRLHPAAQASTQPHSGGVRACAGGETDVLRRAWRREHRSGDYFSRRTAAAATIAATCPPSPRGKGSAAGFGRPRLGAADACLGVQVPSFPNDSGVETRVRIQSPVALPLGGPVTPPRGVRGDVTEVV